MGYCWYIAVILGKYSSDEEGEKFSWLIKEVFLRIVAKMSYENNFTVLTFSYQFNLDHKSNMYQMFVKFIIYEIA